MAPYQNEDFYNPSAPYIQAKEVRDAYNQAKSAIASAISAKAANIVVTASATESNNLAFTAVPRDAHILVSPIEHPSVTNVAQQFQHCGYMSVDQHGRVDLAKLRTQITPQTQLISIALVNHELGTIQPMSDIATLVRAERLRRLQAGEDTPLYLHSDASAALNCLQPSISRLGVDLMTISSPKIYGPKGVAALYVSPEVTLHPLTVGGGQEGSYRSGTENIPGAIGFAAAITDAREHAPHNAKRLSTLKKSAIDYLAAHTDAVFLGYRKHQLASHIALYFPGLDAERLIFILEAQGVLVSTGAACSASKGVKSNVLVAIGLTDEQIAGSLRLTLGALNTPDNVSAAMALIAQAVQAEHQRLGLKTASRPAKTARTTTKSTTKSSPKSRAKTGTRQ
jgi:cysteine desulfurase